MTRVGREQRKIAKMRSAEERNEFCISTPMKTTRDNDEFGDGDEIDLLPRSDRLADKLLARVDRRALQTRLLLEARLLQRHADL